MALVRKTVVLDSERDADLLTWLSEQRNTSQVIRSALYAYSRDNRAAGLQQGCGDLYPDSSEILRAIEELSRKIETLTGAGNRLAIEDPALADALDSLGL